MTAVVTPSGADPVSCASAFDVSGFIDDLPEEAAGELVVRDRRGETAGVVFVEGRRVCWAAARGLSRRLSDLLAAPARLDAAAMEALVMACKKAHTPLGELLVRDGKITAEQLRAALLKHTVESLHVLCAPACTAAWLPKVQGGYCSRFTFTTSEILAQTFACGCAPLAEASGAELAAHFGEGDWAAAFVRAPDRATPVPIAVYGPPPERLTVLLRLGSWAASALDVSSVLGDDAPLVAALVDDGALVAWRSAPVIFAGSTGVHGPARLLNRRAKRRGKDS
jgi:hypothetical protein